MHSLTPVGIRTDQYELSRNAAERSAVLGALRDRRAGNRQLRRATETVAARRRPRAVARRLADRRLS